MSTRKPSAVNTLRLLHHALVSLVGYPPVMERLLTRRLDGNATLR